MPEGVLFMVKDEARHKLRIILEGPKLSGSKSPSFIQSVSFDLITEVFTSQIYNHHGESHWQLVSWLGQRRFVFMDDQNRIHGIILKEGIHAIYDENRRRNFQLLPVFQMNLTC